MSRKNKIIAITAGVLNSQALTSLAGGAVILYLHFLMKRQMVKTPNKRQQWQIANNGKIVFTYAMAKKELGMHASRFMRSLDKLIEHGLIDIEYSGSGSRKGDCSLYSISNRWELYGKPGFIHKTRPKDTRQIGFKYNKQYIKPRSSKK